MIKAKHISLCLYLLLILASLGIVQNVSSTQTDKSASKISVNSFTVISQFSINSNSDFISSGYFTGFGNETHPYIMEGYNITSSSGDLLHIRATTAYFVVQNCIFNGLYTTDRIGVWLDNVAHGTIENNTIYGNGNGINVDGGSSDNSILTNIVYGNAMNGIHIDRSIDNLVSNNSFSNNNWNGIAVSDSANNNVTLNTVSGGGTGINLHNNGSNNLLLSNTIHDTEGTGINLDQSSKNDIMSNAISQIGVGTDSPGIAVWSSSNENEITNNTIFEAPGPGIQVWDSSTLNKISNNTIFNSGGISVGFSTNNIFDRNLVYSSNVQGIGFGEGASSNIVTNNRIYNNQGPGIDVGANMNSVTNNVIYNNNGGGVGIFGTQTTLAFNQIHNNTGTGIAIHSNDNTINDNLVYNNQGDGVVIYSPKNTLSKNTIFSNGLWGLGIWFTNENEISYNSVYNNNQEGIKIWSGNSNNISYNLVYNNKGNCYCLPGGIIIDGDSSSNTVKANVIYGNVDNFGVGLWLQGSDNIATMNDFYQNTVNIQDDGSGNLINSNYYNDWEGKNIYNIVGEAQNRDLEISPNPNHMSSLSIKVDYEDPLAQQGDVTITWGAVEDTFGHAVTYSVSYSTDSGNTWILLESGLAALIYQVDTSTISAGSQTHFRVEANDDIGFISEGSSIVSIDTDDPDDTTSSPIITTSTHIVTSTDKESNGASFVNYPFLYLTVMPLGALIIIIRKKNSSY